MQSVWRVWQFLVSVLWSFVVRATIWGKHIALSRYGDALSNPEVHTASVKHIVRAHEWFPRALLVSCADPRFSGIGGFMLEVLVFDHIRRLHGGPHRIFGVRVAGPDTIVHHRGTYVAHAYLDVLRHQIEVARPSILVVVVHQDCAGVRVSTETHIHYGKDLASVLAPLMSEAGRVSVLLARARPFGWKLETIAEVVPEAWSA